MNTFVQEYKQLVSQIPPKVIHTRGENRHYLAEVERLNARWERLSKAEKDLCETLTLLIEDFEKRNFQFRAASPIEIIKELMLANGLRQKDLIGVFETASVASEVLRGKRQLTTEHIRRLSERFGVSPAVFF